MRKDLVLEATTIDGTDLVARIERRNEFLIAGLGGWVDVDGVYDVGSAKVLCIWHLRPSAAAATLYELAPERAVELIRNLLNRDQSDLFTDITLREQTY